MKLIKYKLVTPTIMNYMTAKIVGTYKVRIVMATTNQIQGAAMIALLLAHTNHHYR